MECLLRRLNFENDIGIALAKTRKISGQDMHAFGKSNQHSQFSARISVEPQGVRFGFIYLLKYVLAAGKIFLPCLGQFHAARRAIEQPYLQMPFEIGNQAAGYRVAYIQRFGDPAKAA